MAELLTLPGESVFDSMHPADPDAIHGERALQLARKLAGNMKGYSKVFTTD